MERKLAEYHNVSLITCSQLTKFPGQYSCVVKFNGTEIGVPQPINIEMGPKKYQFNVTEPSGTLVYGYRRGNCRLLENTETKKKTLVCGYERRRRSNKMSLSPEPPAEQLPPPRRPRSLIG